MVWRQPLGVPLYGRDRGGEVHRLDGFDDAATGAGRDDQVSGRDARIHRLVMRGVGFIDAAQHRTELRRAIGEQRVKAVVALRYAVALRLDFDRVGHVLEQVTAIARFRGLQAGVRYAEGFQRWMTAGWGNLTVDLLP